MSPVSRAPTCPVTGTSTETSTGGAFAVRGPRAAARAFVALTLGAVLSVAPLASRAAGDAAAGKEKAATCVACHGADGIAVASNYPTLAGQYESYLAQSLKAYRSGARQNAIMAGFATQLSDEDIADLAAWFASRSGPLQTAPRP